jgi:catechol 2,3-dioxygenase-like lactoylglutathione lyase family enzyme
MVKPDEDTGGVSQTSASPGPSTGWQLLDMSHTGLTVSNLDHSIEFYRDRLGMKLVSSQEGQRPYLAVITGFQDVYIRTAVLKAKLTTSHVLELLEYRSDPGQPLRPATNQSASAHLCLAVPGMSTIYSVLSGSGVEFVSPPERITSGVNEGAWGCYLRDPDGFTIELFESKP